LKCDIPGEINDTVEKLHVATVSRGSCLGGGSCIFDRGELLAADLALIRALGQELSVQAVSILFASALARALLASEVDGDFAC